MATNGGLRAQYPYSGEASSPRPMPYDFPSPSSSYPSGFGGASPGFYPMAYQISPRFGGSAFIPSADVFADGQKGAVRGNGTYNDGRGRKRNTGLLSSDPVAMHLLVETAMTDTQNFDILTVEEVEALKQEQKGLDSRLGIVRRKLDSETKIRDAARSLARLSSKGQARQMGSNAVQDSFSRSSQELQASDEKVEDLTRELLEIESRMRLIDMQLLMHTAAVLQLTHNGPSKRKPNAQLANGEDRRPDSPASIFTYENERNNRYSGFDERSFYRSPENLDGLMDALQNGTHIQTHSLDEQTEALASISKRVDALNAQLREVLVQVNPERAQQYSLPPSSSTPDAASVDRKMDLLEQGLHDVSAEQAARGNANGPLDVMEERLEGINNQLYAMLSRSDDSTAPPPDVTTGGLQEHLEYMEDSFYKLGEVQYSLNEQIDNLRTMPAKSDETEKYETTLTGLWQIIQAGEAEARERKRERRRLLAEDTDNGEELSPDEDYDVNESFSLPAFSSKVQWLFKRATTLKDKQAILMRQIKQQRELNGKSDAQKEAEFGRLNEQVLSARSEKKSMEGELERAMNQLRRFDQEKTEADSQALHDIQEHNTALEAQLRDAQERALTLESQLKEAHDDARVEAATIQAELAQSATRVDQATAAFAAASTAKDAAEARANETSTVLAAKETELSTLESEVVRLTTELTFAKAELDGAYGTRAERAAESGASTKRELDDLLARNVALTAELAAAQKASDAVASGEAALRESERALKAELAGMAGEYEALTRDAIQNEKDRDALEASIDRLRDEKEALEVELSDERVKWLGVRSPSVGGAGAVSTGSGGGGGGSQAQTPDLGATSIRMLREDFRKMMRERTAEGLKALRNEQEERRKLEALVRQLRKDVLPQKSGLSKTLTA